MAPKDQTAVGPFDGSSAWSSHPLILHGRLRGDGCTSSVSGGAVPNVAKWVAQWEGRLADASRVTDDVSSGRSSAAPSGKTTLTDVDVAKRFGVSRFTVRSWRLKGIGPRFLKLGRAVRYRRQDVDDYERQALVETQARSGHRAM